MKYKDVEVICGIWEKLLMTTNVERKMGLAKGKIVIDNIMAPLNIAREELPGMIEYRRKQREIYKVHGSRVCDIAGEQGENSISFRINDWDGVNSDMEKLGEEFSDILNADDKRKDGTEDLMAREVELEIDPIDYDMCGTLINGNEEMFLIRHGLMNIPSMEDKNKK